MIFLELKLKMAESYKYLSGGGNLYNPPHPTNGVRVAPHTNDPYGEDFPPEVPIRHPDYPYNPLVYKNENRAILKPGERSLNDYKCAVWDENTYKHMGVHPDSLTFSANHQTEGQRYEVIRDSEVVTHHSGQRVRYTVDPVTGMYVYRGNVYDQHVKDPPMWGSKNYYHTIDRSDYYHAPDPVTPLHLSNPEVKPAEYTIDQARLHRPLPDNFTAYHRSELTHQDRAPSHLGRARYDHTLSHLN